MSSITRLIILVEDGMVYKVHTPEETDEIEVIVRYIDAGEVEKPEVEQIDMAQWLYYQKKELDGRD